MTNLSPLFSDLSARLAALPVYFMAHKRDELFSRFLESYNQQVDGLAECLGIQPLHFSRLAGDRDALSDQILRRVEWLGQALKKAKEDGLIGSCHSCDRLSDECHLDGHGRLCRQLGCRSFIGVALMKDGQGHVLSKSPWLYSIN